MTQTSCERCGLLVPTRWSTPAAISLDPITQINAPSDR